MQDGNDLPDSNFLKAVIDSMEEALFVHDGASGSILYTNQRASDLYGYSPEEFHKLSVQDLSTGEPPYDQIHAMGYMQQALAGASPKFAWHAKRRDGQFFWADIRLVSFSHAGMPQVIVSVRDISQLDLADQLLHRDDDFYRILLNDLREGVAIHELVYDETGKPVNYRILDVNKNYEQHTGINPARARGRLGTEIYGTPEPPYWTEFSSVALSGQPRSLKVYFEPLDRHFLISVVSPKPGFFATLFFDQTEQVKLAAENNNMFNNSMDCISISSLDGRFYKVNPAWTRIFGWSEAELMSRSLSEFVHPADLASFNQLKSLLESRRQVSNHEYRFACKDGSYRWLSINATLEGDRYYAVSRDVTSEKANALHLQDLLMKANEHLQASERLSRLGELVAGITHEVNTPLGVATTASSYQFSIINGLDRELQELATNPSKGFSLTHLKETLAAISEAAGIMQRNLVRAGEILSSFKQVAVDQTGDQKRLVNLEELLRQTVSSLSPKFRHTPYTCEVECPERLESESWPGVLSQIVSNLVVNALIHAFRDLDHGKIRITARRSAQAGWVELEVADDGLGVPRALREQVFEPFFTTLRDQGGSGLGLSIVKGLVSQRLGGTLTLTSRTPEECQEAQDRPGTTFHISFPFFKQSAGR